METNRSKGSFYEAIAELPIGAVASMVGAATLSNVWNSLGYTWIRNITMGCAAILWILALVKIIGHFRVFKTEYKNVVPASLYAVFFMLLMILSAWLYQWIPEIAKALFVCAVLLDALHIMIFVFRHILKGVKIETFVPSWFVTFNGIMVSTVVGHTFIPGFSRIILYYGLTVYFIGILFMIIRLVKYPLGTPLLHTKAIVLAPVSLCLVSYLNVEPEPAVGLILLLYGMLLLSLLYILLKIPRFFSVPFNPGFAGLTFPMAIGAVASFRMAGWLTHIGYENWGSLVRDIFGIQTYLTTAIIAFVMFNFLQRGYARCAGLFTNTNALQA
ncbi:MAG: TDT family transporter [Spirochaetaceae bacterium]|jgi:exfoliative toxin A/B|nr:TDT family transporter [Spirochaetaceae bacterium]